MLLEIFAELLCNKRVHKAAHIGVSEFCFGLTFKLRFSELNGYYRTQAFAYVITRKSFIGILKNILFTRKLNEDGEYDPRYGRDTRCYTFGGAQCDRSIPHDGQYVFHGNVIKDTYYEDEHRHVLSDNVFLGGNGSDTSFCNAIGVRSRGNTFGRDCYYNSLGTDCQDNVFGNSCAHNSCGAGSYDNIFSNGCGENVLGRGCAENFFGWHCGSNLLGDYCYTNVIDQGSDNSLGAYCENNVFRTCSHN